jgi:hypothetical protein
MTSNDNPAENKKTSWSGGEDKENNTHIPEVSGILLSLIGGCSSTNNARLSLVRNSTGINVIKNEKIVHTVTNPNTLIT